LVPLLYALPMDPSCIPSCVYQFCVVVQGISPLIWRRRLVHSDMPLATLHTLTSATALGKRISTGFVESTVHQVISKRFCERQQMQ
jgi:hypothetical protein